jgi:hypothetical protein
MACAARCDRYYRRNEWISVNSMGLIRRLQTAVYENYIPSVTSRGDCDAWGLKLRSQKTYVVLWLQFLEQATQRSRKQTKKKKETKKKRITPLAFTLLLFLSLSLIHLPILVWSSFFRSTISISLSFRKHFQAITMGFGMSSNDFLSLFTLTKPTSSSEIG